MNNLGGYQPEKSNLDANNPPKGGSGVPLERKKCRRFTIIHPKHFGKIGTLVDGTQMMFTGTEVDGLGVVSLCFPARPGSDIVRFVCSIDEAPELVKLLNDELVNIYDCQYQYKIVPAVCLK